MYEAIRPTAASSNATEISVTGSDGETPTSRDPIPRAARNVMTKPAMRPVPTNTNPWRSTIFKMSPRPRPAPCARRFHVSSARPRRRSRYRRLPRPAPGQAAEHYGKAAAHAVKKEAVGSAQGLLHGLYVGKGSAGARLWICCSTIGISASGEVAVRSCSVTKERRVLRDGLIIEVGGCVHRIVVFALLVTPTTSMNGPDDAVSLKPCPARPDRAKAYWP